MKALVVYYSRTGNTRKVAEEIAKALNADVEELTDQGSRKGIFGWLRSGKEGMSRMDAKITDVKKFPGNYDVTIIGTPIWGWNMSSPVRTYLGQFGDRINKAAFYCTYGSSPGKTFAEMAAAIKQKPLATMMLKEKEVKGNAFSEKLNSFIEEINQNINPAKEDGKKQ